MVNVAIAARRFVTERAQERVGGSCRNGGASRGMWQAARLPRRLRHAHAWYGAQPGLCDMPCAASNTACEIIVEMRYHSISSCCLGRVLISCFCF